MKIQWGILFFILFLYCYYLYISLKDKMYFLTYVNMTGVRGAFYEIAQSIAIGGESEGTDLSALADSWRR